MEELFTLTFYKSFFDSINELEAEERLELYDAIMRYQFNQTEPEFTNKYLRAIWLNIKPTIDAGNKKKIDGQKGGRQKNKTLVVENKNHTFENEKTTLFENENHTFENEKTTLFENENHTFENTESKEKDKVKDKVKEKVKDNVKDNVVEARKFNAQKITPAPADKVMLFYLNNINPMPVESEIQILEDYRKQLCDDLLLFAMQKAIENKSRKLKYIKAIWDSWLSKGITTLAEAKEEKRPQKVESNMKYFDSSGQYDNAKYYTEL